MWRGPVGGSLEAFDFLLFCISGHITGGTFFGALDFLGNQGFPSKSCFAMFYSILGFSDHAAIWFKQLFKLRVRSARISEVNASTPVYSWGETDSRSRWCLSINLVCLIFQERTIFNFKDFKIYLHNRVHCVFMFSKCYVWFKMKLIIIPHVFVFKICETN